MEAPKCRFCGLKEWRHVCGGETKAVKVVGSKKGVGAVAKGRAREPEELLAGSTGGTEKAIPKQRWARDSYNAYQREYMRVYRKRKSVSSGDR